ncbi:MAG TPA: hypothetical protein VNJ51_12400 [Candidatus Dormibacteraeota bacterium]|nr:hypothetical protein [Candidatus Dormibacteraeota bacterium]
MRRLASAWIAAIFLIAALAAAGRPAAAAGLTWPGYIVHVSTENIKVYDPDAHKTRSFLILPKFKNIWSKDGKTTYQMAQLKPHMWVVVDYDTNALGIRHADRIVVERR